MAHQDRPAEKEAIRTTIVGGRPPGCGQDVGAIPRGIEVLVKKASVDPAFKELLLQKRAEAAASIGLTLAPAEALMLAAVPAQQLDTIIARTKVGEMHRAAFLGKAATLMLAALGGATLSGCGDSPRTRTLGDQPDRPVSLGVQPDRPPAKEVPPPEAPTRLEPTDGVRPSRPPAPVPQPPDEVRATKGLRPDKP